MAPIKFEENIKEKLEERILKPSANSWDDLAKQLDAQDKKQTNKMFWWIGVAASIVGVLLVTQLVNKNTIEHTTPTIVNTDTEILNEDKINEEHITVDDIQLTNNVSNEEEAKTKETKVSNPSTIKNTSATEQLDLTSTSDKLQDYAQGERGNSKEAPKTEKALLNELPFETLKLNEVVAQIKTMSEDGNMVSEEDIDALLQQAEREIVANKIYNESTKVVDANALLQDVETELEQSFRDRVFKSLKSSYYTVKTAVADRNN